MEGWFGTVDWQRIFLPSTTLVEIVLRGTLMYVALFTLLRLTLKRQIGAIGITNLLVVVLIADAAQNGMADDYASVTDGVLLVGTIIFWSWFLDWLGYRAPRIQHLVHPPALRLVRDGRMLRRHMAQELITEDELRSQLRLQGVDDLDEVGEAFIESDGRISVVRRSGGQGKAPDRKLG